LDELGLSNFDPSVSPKLTARLIRDNCRTPFQWRLNSTHYVGRSPADVERWFYEAASDGASGIFTYVAREMCNPEDAAKVRAFIRAAKQVKQLLGDGCRREDIQRRVE
jgi:glycosidase